MLADRSQSVRCHLIFLQLCFIDSYRLPGLESSKNNLKEEDELYDEMMTSVLKIVLYPSLQEEVRKRKREHQSDLFQLYSNIPLGFWSDVTELVNATESGEDSAPQFTIVV